MNSPDDHRARLGEKAAELLAEMRQDSGSPPGRSSGPRAGETAQGGNSVKVLSAILGVVILVALVIVGLRFMPKNGTVPAELLGTWETEYPSHAEHPMEIATETVRFHTAEGWMAYAIVQVQSRDEESRVWYRFDYEAEGEEFELTFYYYAPPDERLQFENQPHLEWRKTEREGS
jgi:hypothetical protein